MKTLNLRGHLPPIPDHLNEFNVSGNPGLTAVSAFPPGLQYFSAMDCGLEGLPDFPDTSRLRMLEVSRNPKLQELHPLPATLAELKAISCGLRHLHDFPAGSKLELLMVDGNPGLTALPPLPHDLEQLYARNCQLQQLPELHELSRLNDIYVSGNPLVQFPTIPSDVWYVYATECRLTALPALPERIREADFSNNQITDLSQPAPQSIELLDLTGNPITEVPDWVFHLRPEAEVRVSVGHLSERARQDLMARSTSGQGPLIIFDTQNGASQDLVVRAAQAPVPTAVARNPVEQARNTDPFRKWRQWARDPNVSIEQRQQRSTAMELVKSHPRSEHGFLNLSLLSLRGELPQLPGNVTHVDISSNPGLTLSSIPSTLKGLRAEFCRFEDMPDCSEASQLVSLHLDNNPQMSVLRALPPSLIELTVAGCGLVQLPEFPDGSRLQALTISGNPLEQLPRLPRHLKNLLASGCHFAELPELPRAVWRADFSNNQIRSSLPPAPGATALLRYLDLRDNPITVLPEWVFHLRPHAEVQISASHMSEEVHLAIASRLSSDSGPRIIFDLRDRVSLENQGAGLIGWQSHAYQDQTQPLENAVAAWMDPASDGRIAWRAFATEEGAPAFADFLNRLSKTDNYFNSATRGPFRKGVQQLLNNMAESPPLRADCFAICTGATETCQDRVTLSYQSMAVPRLAEAVRRGDFDDNGALPDFIDQARSLYRRDVLTDIANRKAAKMRFVDPIEVHLAYQVRLNEALDLRLDGNQMAYLGMSGLTERDFRSAKKKVLRANQGFANHLINHSGPWAQLIQRRAPQLYEEMQEARHTAIEPQRLAPALRAHLAQAGLENDPDASREAGRLVSDALTLHAQRPFVRQFLRDCQLDPNVLGV